MRAGNARAGGGSLRARRPDLRPLRSGAPAQTDSRPPAASPGSRRGFARAGRGSRTRASSRAAVALTPDLGAAVRVGRDPRGGVDDLGERVVDQVAARGLSAILAGVLARPDAARAAFLVLLVPVIAEVAAREDLAGTRALVYSQPGVPSSPVLWKAAAVALVSPDPRRAADDPRVRRLARARPRLRRGSPGAVGALRGVRLADLGRQALLGPLPRRLVHGPLEPADADFTASLCKAGTRVCVSI